jgi:hypothetical protein
MIPENMADPAVRKKQTLSRRGELVSGHCLWLDELAAEPRVIEAYLGLGHLHWNSAAVTLVIIAVATAGVALPAPLRCRLTRRLRPLLGHGRRG